MNRSLVVVTLALSVAASAYGQATPNWPMRELIVQSNTVVLATPVGPAASGRFKASHVLLGTALKDGDDFKVDDLSNCDMTVPAAKEASARKPAGVKEALLFLGFGQSDAPHFWLTSSGMRILTADGVYYAAGQQGKEAFTLYPFHSDVHWDDLVRKAAADAKEVRQVRFLQKIEDPHRRNTALLGWIEGRRTEFGAGLSMDEGKEPSYGWGSLEQEIFQWILESRIPADCWTAVKVYAELNCGEAPEMRLWAFSTREGRKLLLAIAADDSVLDGDRVRALQLLSLEDTLWPLHIQGAPDVEKLDEKEQVALIDRITPLLKDPSFPVQAAAAGVLLTASMPGRDVLESFRTRRSAPALITAYKLLPPGDARNALAKAVYTVGGRKAWQELTGNGHGVLAIFHVNRNANDAKVNVSLEVEPSKGDDALGFGNEPTLVLERLDAKGQVVEKKELPPGDVFFGGPIKPGPWLWGGLAHIFFSTDGNTPGLWRMTAKGVAGDDEAPWKSEPLLFRLTPTPQPGQTPSSAPRIVFDP